MSYLYPYGDTQQLNLSWFLAKFKELYDYITNLDPDDIALATVLSRFTNEYNSSTNYIPGDYVIHEGFIYKANQSTTGNFNPQAWDAALPVNDIQGLRILLGGISTDLTDLEQNAVTNLQYTPGAASADGLLRQTKNGAAETVMTVDKKPTENSQNPVKSGAVFSELEGLKGSLNSVQGQITENIQSTLTASKNYAIGDCFVYNGDLYRVTANISNGSAITIGTNAVKTTLDSTIKDNYAFDSIPFIAASGVNSNASFDVTGNMMTGVGYISTTAAFTSGGQFGTVAKTIRKRQQFTCIDINNHTSYAVYYNTNGTITAPEGLPIGYFRLVGTIII